MRALLIIRLLLAAVSLRAAEFRLATFEADVTIPVGHPCMGGGIMPARTVADPLTARGFVLIGGEKPFVLVSLDWCEIRGSSYDQWKRTLAEAAGTEPARVLVHSTHVHDAPVMDADAEKLLRDMEATGAWRSLPAPDPKAPVQFASVCWPAFNDECIARVVAALRASLPAARRVTHFGIGRAKVERVASNRRFLRANGTLSHGRMSRTTDPDAQAADEGAIDPWLRTLSFWDGDTPLCALHSYAVHPMSYYGGGEVSADFPGLARTLMQRAHPAVFQIYATGCAGNVTAGKWNTGDRSHRTTLAERLHVAMEGSWRALQRHPLTRADFRVTPLPLGARDTPEHTEAILRERLRSAPKPFDRSEAAMGLAWYERVKRGHRIDLPVLDLGPAQLLLLPGEAYVEFQLHAQQLRPESFVMVLGYGECGTGYIPIERSWAENDTNLRDWAWTPPGSEAVMKAALRTALGTP